MLVALWLFSDTKHLDLLDKSPGLRSGWEDVKQHLKIEEVSFRPNSFAFFEVCLHSISESYFCSNCWRKYGAFMPWVVFYSVKLWMINLRFLTDFLIPFERFSDLIPI